VFDVTRFHITLTQAPGHRALTTDEIQQTADLHHTRVTLQPDLQTAIANALADSHALIIITGSLRVAALSREILGLLDDNELEEARQTRVIFEGNDYLKKLP
jgi:hypothetical protein